MQLNSDTVVETVETKFSYVIHKDYALVLFHNAPVQVYKVDAFNRNFGKRGNKYFKNTNKCKYIVKREAFENYQKGNYSWNKDNGGICYKISDAVAEINKKGEPILIDKGTHIDGFFWNDGEPLRSSYTFTVYGLTTTAIAKLKKHPKVTNISHSYRDGREGWNMCYIALELSDYNWKRVCDWLKSGNKYDYKYNFEESLKTRILKIKPEDYVKEYYCDDYEDDYIYDNY